MFFMWSQETRLKLKRALDTTLRSNRIAARSGYWIISGLIGVILFRIFAIFIAYLQIDLGQLRIENVTWLYNEEGHGLIIEGGLPGKCPLMVEFGMVSVSLEDKEVLRFRRRNIKLFKRAPLNVKAMLMIDSVDEKSLEGMADVLANGGNIELEIDLKIRFCFMKLKPGFPIKKEIKTGGDSSASSMSNEVLERMSRCFEVNVLSSRESRKYGVEEIGFTEPKYKGRREINGLKDVECSFRVNIDALGKIIAEKSPYFERCKFGFCTTQGDWDPKIDFIKKVEFNREREDGNLDAYIEFSSGDGRVQRSIVRVCKRIKEYFEEKKESRKNSSIHIALKGIEIGDGIISGCVETSVMSRTVRDLLSAFLGNNAALRLCVVLYNGTCFFVTIGLNSERVEDPMFKVKVDGDEDGNLIYWKVEYVELLFSGEENLGTITGVITSVNESIFSLLNGIHITNGKGGILISYDKEFIFIESDNKTQSYGRVPVTFPVITHTFSSKEPDKANIVTSGKVDFGEKVDDRKVAENVRVGVKRGEFFRLSTANWKVVTTISPLKSQFKISECACGVPFCIKCDNGISNLLGLVECCKFESVLDLSGYSVNEFIATDPETIIGEAKFLGSYVSTLRGLRHRDVVWAPLHRISEKLYAVAAGEYMEEKRKRSIFLHHTLNIVELEGLGSCKLVLSPSGYVFKDYLQKCTGKGLLNVFTFEELRLNNGALELSAPDPSVYLYSGEGGPVVFFRAMNIRAQYKVVGESVRLKPLLSRIIDSLCKGDAKKKSIVETSMLSLESKGLLEKNRLSLSYSLNMPKDLVPFFGEHFSLAADGWGSEDEKHPEGNDGPVLVELHAVESGGAKLEASLKIVRGEWVRAEAEAVRARKVVCECEPVRAREALCDCLWAPKAAARICKPCLSVYAIKRGEQEQYGSTGEERCDTAHKSTRCLLESSRTPKSNSKTIYRNSDTNSSVLYGASVVLCGEIALSGNLADAAAWFERVVDEAVELRASEHLVDEFKNVKDRAIYLSLACNAMRVRSKETIESCLSKAGEMAISSEALCKNAFLRKILFGDFEDVDWRSMLKSGSAFKCDMDQFSKKGMDFAQETLKEFAHSSKNRSMFVSLCSDAMEWKNEKGALEYSFEKVLAFLNFCANMFLNSNKELGGNAERKGFKPCHLYGMSETESLRRVNGLPLFNIALEELEIGNGKANAQAKLSSKFTDELADSIRALFSGVFAMPEFFAIDFSLSASEVLKLTHNSNLLLGIDGLKINFKHIFENPYFEVPPRESACSGLFAVGSSFITDLAGRCGRGCCGACPSRHVRSSQDIDAIECRSCGFVVRNNRVLRYLCAGEHQAGVGRRQPYLYYRVKEPHVDGEVGSHALSIGLRISYVPKAKTLQDVESAVVDALVLAAGNLIRAPAAPGGILEIAQRTLAAFRLAYAGEALMSLRRSLWVFHKFDRYAFVATTVCKSGNVSSSSVSDSDPRLGSEELSNTLNGTLDKTLKLAHSSKHTPKFPIAFRDPLCIGNLFRLRVNAEGFVVLDLNLPFRLRLVGPSLSVSALLFPNLFVQTHLADYLNDAESLGYSISIPFRAFLCDTTFPLDHSPLRLIVRKIGSREFRLSANRVVFKTNILNPVFRYIRVKRDSGHLKQFLNLISDCFTHSEVAAPYSASDEDTVFADGVLGALISWKMAAAHSLTYYVQDSQVFTWPISKCLKPSAEERERWVSEFNKAEGGRARYLAAQISPISFDHPLSLYTISLLNDALLHDGLVEVASLIKKEPKDFTEDDYDVWRGEFVRDMRRSDEERSPIARVTAAVIKSCFYPLVKRWLLSCEEKVFYGVRACFSLVYNFAKWGTLTAKDCVLNIITLNFVPEGVKSQVISAWKDYVVALDKNFISSVRSMPNKAIQVTKSLAGYASKCANWISSCCLPGGAKLWCRGRGELLSEPKAKNFSEPLQDPVCQGSVEHPGSLSLPATDPSNISRNSNKRKIPNNDSSSDEFRSCEESLSGERFFSCEENSGSSSFDSAIQN